MAEQEQLVEEDDEFLLSSEELRLILKSLDVYGYSLIASGNMLEFYAVQEVAHYIVSKIPKQDLNS